MNSKIEQLKELARIMKDTPYALRTYLQTYDNTQKKYVPMDLFEDQVQLIQDYENYNENITRKYRQAGVTTVTAAWLSKKLQLAKPENPERVLLIANKRDTAVEMANKIRNFLDQWPEWINVGFSPDKNSESRFRLNNGCEVKAVATSPDALRGYTPTILVFDEAAYIEAGEDFWSASMASLSTGGKIILISTPNGYDPIYYGVYDQAIRKMNDFHITDLRWFKDPRYTKDLCWVKCNDIVHYMLNREQYNDDEVVKYDLDLKDYVKHIEDGYKPFSSWFERMSKKFLYDRRKISQELECDFLGSGDGVIPKEIQESIAKNMIRVPIEKFMQGTMWQWKEPVQGHRYIMGVDVSRGDSEDFSSINIIDFDDREQVVEYIGKIPPDDLAAIAYKWGILYSAFIVIDITGGMGVATSRKLQEMNYKNLFIDGVNVQNKWEYNAKAMEKIPGLNFNNKRTQIVAAFEEQLRKGFIVRSNRLLNELNTFVYINGRPDHMKGAHDDAIMSMSMALYAGDICFNQLERNEASSKAMMNSWVLNERTYETDKTFYSYGQSMDMVGSMTMDPSFYHRDNPMKINQEAYKEYNWLFGNPHKGLKR
jgi:Terminase large subunit, T4likevirus-type, N-terminal